MKIKGEPSLTSLSPSQGREPLRRLPVPGVSARLGSIPSAPAQAGMSCGRLGPAPPHGARLGSAPEVRGGCSRLCGSCQAPPRRDQPRRPGSTSRRCLLPRPLPALPPGGRAQRGWLASPCPPARGQAELRGHVPPLLPSPLSPLPSPFLLSTPSHGRGGPLDLGWATAIGPSVAKGQGSAKGGESQTSGLSPNNPPTPLAGWTRACHPLPTSRTAPEQA